MLSRVSLKKSSVFLQATRLYAIKSDLKIKWVRPEKISCIKPEKSGDLSSFAQPVPSQFMLDFEKSEELKNANEIIKKMFTLEQNRRKPSVETFVKETVDKVRRHELDCGSYEAKSK